MNNAALALSCLDRIVTPCGKARKRRLNIAPRWNVRKENDKAEEKHNSKTLFSVEHIEARLSEYQHVQVDYLIQLSPSFGSDWQPGSMIQVINGDSEVVV